MTRKLKSFLRQHVLPPANRRILRYSPYRGARMAKPAPSSPQEARLLAQALQHLDLTANLPKELHGLPASSRWTALLERMRASIKAFRTVREAIGFAQSRIDFDHRDTTAGSSHLYPLHAATLKAEYAHLSRLLTDLSESPYSRPETMLNVHGQLISNVFFFHLSYLLTCLTWVKKTEMVCEIGGGYGAPARYWLLNPAQPVKTYTIIDFPESLFFAEVFLQSNFADVSLLYVGDARPLAADAFTRHRVVLCPIQFIGALAPVGFDLVINTGSMQEMTEEWVDFWMDWLRRQDCRFFYSLNYFGQPLNNLAEGGNTWSPRLTPEWMVRLKRSNPAFVMQQTTRHYAELLAEKTGLSPHHTPAALAARYAQARELFLNGQGLLECMDIVRFHPGEEILWDLLQRTTALPTVPKEAYYLAESLARSSSESFQREHGKALAAIFARLKELRASGQENCYSR